MPCFLLPCGAGLRRSQEEAEEEDRREWRRKSVKLREGEFLHGELQVRDDKRTSRFSFLFF